MAPLKIVKDALKQFVVLHYSNLLPYVPQRARRIINNNNCPRKSLEIKIKGIHPG